MEISNAPNGASSSSSAAPLPSFSDVTPESPDPSLGGATHPADEAPEDRKRRLKKERDQRYRTKLRGDAPPPPSQPPQAPPTGAPKAAPGRTPVGDAINDLRQQFAASPGPNDAPAPAPSGPAFVATGEVLLGMCNATLPGLVARFASRGRVDPVSADDVRLSPEQVKMLKPSATPAEAYLLQNLHPVVTFAISMVGVFSANVPPPTANDRKAKAEAKARAKDKRATR